LADFNVIIPSDIFSDIPNLREKTVRIANFVRIINLFRVKRLIIFHHHKQDKEFELLLDFFLTPSYLRKFKFKLDRRLRFTGCAPPIRAFYESWKEKRIGIIIDYDPINNISKIEAGLSNQIKIRTNKNLVGKIITVKKIEKNWEICSENTPEEIIKPIFIKNITQFLNNLNRETILIISTSRKGKMINLNLLNELNQKIKKVNEIFFVFGSPKEGLYEIYKEIGENLEDLSDYVLNLFPNQGIETIRTDEAIFGTLSIFNILRS